MLEPIRHILSKQRNILASGSPRRKEMLASIRFPFEVSPSTYPEDLDKETFSHPCEYVKETAKQKAIEVWRRLASGGDAAGVRPDLVIGADTVVTMDEVIYEKPKDPEENFQVLSKLAGKKHTVFTGVALLTRASAAIPTLDGVLQPDANLVAGDGSTGGRPADPRRPPSADPLDDFVVTTFHEATEVSVAQMSADIIRAYVETGEGMDKAGGYGIQGIGRTIIEGIRGDFFNVMGLPVHRLCKELYHMYVD